MSSKTKTLDSHSLFLQAHNSSKIQIPNSIPPPHSFSLLSDGSPLPAIPTDFPQSKLIPKTRFVVDGFRLSGDFSVSYFLSHFHSDHYAGLSSGWSKGIIFCSRITARLLVEILNISPLFIVSLELSESVSIDGCDVTIIDANHCPGAVQFLFKISSCGGKSETYIHTGDFRFCDSMKYEPALGKFIGTDAVFLDTTYCNPKFVFPSQEESIEYIVGVVDRLGVENEGSLKSVLFLIATYVIGKEKILLEISRRCKRKIYVDSKKMKIMTCAGIGKDTVFTEDESETDVHVVGWNLLGETWPYFRPNFSKMEEIMNQKDYDRVVGFVPTGWTYEVKRNKFSVRSKDKFDIHLVPYSEHSNYAELREYIKFLKPKRVIPTVGMDIDKFDSKHVNAMLKHFGGLIDEMAVKQDFLLPFYHGHQGTEGNAHKEAGNVQKKEIVLGKEGQLPHITDTVDVSTEKTLHSFGSEQESCLDNLAKLHEDKNDQIVQLRDCLPSWVTNDQIVDLLSVSRDNIIDAVSNFYERETEFYDQAMALAVKINPVNVSALPAKHCFTNISGSSPISTCYSKLKSPAKENSTKSSLTPRKAKASVKNKPSKKARNSSSNVEPSSSKQRTITSFFNKNSSTAPQDVEVKISSEEQSSCKRLLMIEPTILYEQEVNQFIQILNGNESLVNVAKKLLEETKGDVNMALNIYYSKPEGYVEQENNRSLDTITAAKTLSCSQDLFSQKEKMSSFKLQSTISLPAHGLSPKKTDRGLVSLSLEKYSPIEHAPWNHGQPAPYIHIARTFFLVENEKGRIKATSMLCNMFRSLLALSPEDVLPALYLCTNKLAPDYENIELNIGGSIVVAALEEACGTDKARIRELYESLGDLGDVAQLCRQTQSLLAPPPPLSIQHVFSVLRKISIQTGGGSTARKRGLIVNLMRCCRESEIKFIVRTLVKNLRIGAMMRTVLPSLAQAVVMNSSVSTEAENLKEQLQCISEAIVEAYNKVPNLDLLVPCLLEKGVDFSSTTLSVVPGIPIKPMLAKISNGIPQALKLFGNKGFTCEYKYDGQRAQIHRVADGTVRVFSRNGDETTLKFPDLVNIIKESCMDTASTFIVDAEIVAVDRKNGCKLLSFQELSSRERGGRNSSISIDNIKIDICIFLFDVMIAKGEQLLDFPLRLRRKYLRDLFGEEKLGYLEYAKEMTVEAEDVLKTNEATMTRLNTFLDDAIRSSCEGIMVKSLDIDAKYCPSKRSDSWLKVKQDYVEGMGDSLDLVPIGAWHGNGRKAGWYSPFLMACYEPDSQEFQSVCRVMSGFSDAFYIEMKELFSGDKVLSKKPMYYETAETPDMWFLPEVVWEIKGADFTVSPVHKAAVGLVHPSRGISVRFPRFVRAVTDRKPEECSVAMDIAEMFHSQTRKMEVTDRRT
ncbi:DNA ligase 6 [Impatiens glandulifera]|uniref:DNA ligase 6 n=1 Tax=Impatiens glandulifera TaxID=253017 RepID=UPI001FB0AF73|nr:DNA ligase 6 [Impatiens glandulifera]